MEDHSTSPGIPIRFLEMEAMMEEATVAMEEVEEMEVAIEPA
jgi:hypothetical protein